MSNSVAEERALLDVLEEWVELAMLQVEILRAHHPEGAEGFGACPICRESAPRLQAKVEQARAAQAAWERRVKQKEKEEKEEEEGEE